MQWDDWALSGPLAVTDVDPDLAFFTLIVFVITLGVLWKFAWKPIVEGLDKREKSIADQIEQAKVDAEKAQQSLQEYEAKLAAAADEAKALLTEARQEAEHAKERLVAEAKEAAERERQRAIVDIQAAKDEAVRELAQRSVDSAISLAGQLVRKELDASSHAGLIEESLEKFSAN
jgi:F-type H+-transporting ATPase subunit b